MQLILISVATLEPVISAQQMPLCKVLASITTVVDIWVEQAFRPADQRQFTDGFGR